MSRIDILKAEIEQLPKEELAELIRWIFERDYEIWDREIEDDVLAGRLQFLIDEARGEKGVT